MIYAVVGLAALAILLAAANLILRGQLRQEQSYGRWQEEQLIDLRRRVRGQHGEITAHRLRLVREQDENEAWHDREPTWTPRIVHRETPC